MTDDCDRALARLYEFLDHEIAEADADEIRRHIEACEPCLEAYGVEEMLRGVIRRGCSAKAPESLRLRVVTQFTTITYRSDSSN